MERPRVSPDKVSAFVKLVSTASSPVFSSIPLCTQYVESLWAIMSEGKEERVEFCAALYAHPTALSTLIDRVTVPTEHSTDSEWTNAHKIAVGFSQISQSSALISERLVQSDKVLELMAACCRHCRTPPFELSVSCHLAMRYILLLSDLAVYGKSKYHGRLVNSGVFASAITMFGAMLTEGHRRGVSGCDPNTVHVSALSFYHVCIRAPQV